MKLGMEEKMMGKVKSHHNFFCVFWVTFKECHIIGPKGAPNLLEDIPVQNIKCCLCTRLCGVREKSWRLYTGWIQVYHSQWPHFQLVRSKKMPLIKNRMPLIATSVNTTWVHKTWIYLYLNSVYKLNWIWWCTERNRFVLDWGGIYCRLGAQWSAFRKGGLK